ncbi:glycosyltransferase family 9 protein [Pseudofrankia asymbiotica]|uniref:glycosyltransferase family 9 protein n=1 Tax=Pseudofrankia asymbiotica TaxID=1834516 RepID=UPI001A7E06EF|nr:glycosyltransferase family 9 protein [Pseudofrankia asymbiotica]
MKPRVLVARLDSDGDVLLAGPAIRAMRAGARHLTLLVGPRGQHAARLLPAVDDVLVWRCPWIDATPGPVRRDDVDALVGRLARGRYDEALVLTSFHQSPLPTALLLRMAGVGRIAAASEDYPGSLLDVRHRLPETGLHEVERGLSTAAAFGYPRPAGDDGRLAVRGPLPDPAPLTGGDRYVVLHPGTSVPARGWSAAKFAELAAALADRGTRVVVTGGPDETALTAAIHDRAVASADSEARARLIVDLGGRTDLPALAGVLDRAAAVVVANTGPAHLAAAVGTPVVSLFAPTVPAERWAPYTSRRVLLGDQTVPCAGCRARDCAVDGHPCLEAVTSTEALAALDTLLAAPNPPPVRLAWPAHPARPDGSVRPGSPLSLAARTPAASAHAPVLRLRAPGGET